jgi:hypothetical protein
MSAESHVRLKQATNRGPPVVNPGLAQVLLDIVQQVIGKDRDKQMPLYTI